jgi:hypothetical protein
MQILATSQHNFETNADGSSWAPVQYTQRARGPEKIKKKQRYQLLKQQEQ